MNTSAAHAQSNFGVVVGFDGSDHAIDALVWGAHEATVRGIQLTVVASYQHPYKEYLQSMVAAKISDPSQEVAEEKLNQARQVVAQRQLGDDVEYYALVGDPTASLIELSNNADLVVVGRRGHGKFWGQVLGSVASALPPHSRCPTVVVYHPEDTPAPNFAEDTRPICVGVDGSENSRYAAIAAARAAVRHSVPLEVVNAQQYFTGASNEWVLAPDEALNENIDAEMRDILEQEVAFIGRHVPDVMVTAVPVRKRPAEAMIECTQRAQLTVVGSRGLGGFGSLLLGSVSRATLSNASGPVMVIPAVQDD